MSRSVLLLALACACTEAASTDTGTPAGNDTQPDAAVLHLDGGHRDAGTSSPDASGIDDDAGTDAGAADDAGSQDAGTPDAGPHDAGSPAACVNGATEACDTACGSSGTKACASGAWGSCAAPPEACNLRDDDCNGACDDLLGCRVPVVRSYAAAAGWHFYTTDDAEASCCGYGVESYAAFHLFATAQPGLVPFHRCLVAGGAHRYTTDATCGPDTLEGPLGYVATSATCGAVPLYELVHASSHDHLYTTSEAESESAQAGGYALTGTAGYVWPASCGGASCTWPSPAHLTGSFATSQTGFPTAWYGFPIAGAKTYRALTGTVTVSNSTGEYAEVLFILQTLSGAACTEGRWPASTPQFGPPGARGIGQFIVKAPSQGTFTHTVDLHLPGGLPVADCVLVGLNGGPVTAPHLVTSAVDLSLAFDDAPSAQGLLGMDGEFCFGQDWGCQAATTDDSLSFATVTPVSRHEQLVALVGNVSDSTFDGTSAFGRLPAGAWTATNDFYVFHASDCAGLGVGAGPAGPGHYRESVPAGATHLLSVPLSGTGRGVQTVQVFQPFSGVTLDAGDCLVAIYGLQGGGGFDNETQVTALVAP